MRKLFGWDIRDDGGAGRRRPRRARAESCFFLICRANARRTCPRAHGVFHGLTTENMTPDFMARAVVEGVTLGLAYGLRRFKDLGIAPEEIRLTGGGSKSAVWRQIAADVLGLPAVALQGHRRRGVRRGHPRGLDLLPGERQTAQLEKLVDDLVAVDKKTRVEPGKESRTLYRELLLRQIDLTKKLKTGGYL